MLSACEAWPHFQNAGLTCLWSAGFRSVFAYCVCLWFGVAWPGFHDGFTRREELLEILRGLLTGFKQCEKLSAALIGFRA